MREFLFPDGIVWLLFDSAELAVAKLEDGGVALLIFSDEDLAAHAEQRIG